MGASRVFGKFGGGFGNGIEAVNKEATDSAEDEECGGESGNVGTCFRGNGDERLFGGWRIVDGDLGRGGEGSAIGLGIGVAGWGLSGLWLWVGRIGGIDDAGLGSGLAVLVLISGGWGLTHLGDGSLVGVVEGVRGSVRGDGRVQQLVIGLGVIWILGRRGGVVWIGVKDEIVEGAEGGFKFGDELFAGGLAELRGFVEGFCDDLPDHGIEPVDGGRLGVHDGVGDGDNTVASERFFTGEHFVEDDAEAEDVGSGVDVASVDLFGRHVGWGAKDLAIHGDIGFKSKAGDAEVGEFDGAVGEDLDVFWFDIAVDDTVVVGEDKGFGDFDCDFDGFVGGDGALFFEGFAEVLAIEELHGEVVAA